MNRCQDGKEGMGKVARRMVGVRLVLVEVVRQRRGKAERDRKKPLLFAKEFGRLKE